MAILAPPEGLTPTQGHKFGNVGKRPQGHPNDASFVPRGVRIKKNDFLKTWLFYAYFANPPYGLEW